MTRPFREVDVVLTVRIALSVRSRAGLSSSATEPTAYHASDVEVAGDSHGGQPGQHSVTHGRTRTRSLPRRRVSLHGACPLKLNPKQDTIGSITFVV